MILHLQARGVSVCWPLPALITKALREAHVDPAAFPAAMCSATQRVSGLGKGPGTPRSPSPLPPYPYSFPDKQPPDSACTPPMMGTLLPSHVVHPSRDSHSPSTGEKYLWMPGRAWQPSTGSVCPSQPGQRGRAAAKSSLQVCLSPAQTALTLGLRTSFWQLPKSGCPLWIPPNCQ